MNPFAIFPTEYPCTCVKGWTCPTPGTDWPSRCGRCKGARKLSTAYVARVIGEADTRPLYRILGGRGIKPETGARIVDKLSRFFPEAFQ